MMKSREVMLCCQFDAGLKNTNTIPERNISGFDAYDVCYAGLVMLTFRDIPIARSNAWYIVSWKL